MAPPAYLCLGSVPIVDNCRTVAYAQAGYRPRGLDIRDCGCCDEDFADYSNDGIPFSTPAGDDMPWVSMAEPDSEDFAGILVTDITGLDVAPLTRQVIDYIDHGGVLGRARYPVRVIEVNGILVGRTCQAADWGLRWLAHELRDNPCAPGSLCGGSDLTYLLSCPSEVGSCEIPFTSPNPDFADRIAPYERILHKVGLVDGPEVVDRLNLARHCGCDGADCSLPIVRFRLAAGDPHAYRSPMEVVAETPLTQCEISPECVHWIVVADGQQCDDPCDPVIDCADDAACPAPPEVPPTPIGGDPCACDPLQIATTCVEVNTEIFFDVGDTLPLVHVFAGDTDLRGLKLTFTPNPLELPFNQVDICATCYEVNLPFLPAGGTWHLDSSTRTSTIICAGGQEQVANISGEEGGAIVWPVFTCPGIAYALCLSVDCSTVNANATISMSVVNRHA